MYQEEQIIPIIDNVIELSKDQETILKKNKDENSLPDYNPIYRESVELSEEMAVHMELKKFPEKLLKAKAPNEDPAEWEFGKSIYQPITVPYMDKALGVVNRIWNSANYVIKWQEDKEIHKGNTAQDYFEKNYPIHRSLLSYFKSVVTKRKFKDGNSVLTVKINNIQEDGSVDQTNLVEPVAVIYEAEQVIDFKENKFLLIELREKSLVKFGNSSVKEGRVFEFQDTENIWRITQVGKKVDYEFEYKILYNHGLGILPAQKLKGKPKEIDGHILYESHFSSAIPNLNTALCTNLTLDKSIYAHVFPQRWEYVDPCNAEGCGQGCDPGYVMGGNDKAYPCGNCHGTGKKNKHSPLGVIQLQTPDRMNPDSLKDVGTPPAGYIAPDTKVLEFAYNKLNNDIINAFAFVNIDVSNSSVKGTETALGKTIDREELFSFLLLVSDELFDLLDFTHDILGKIRYGIDFETPYITKPVNFAMRSDEELTNELIAARTAQIPDIAIRKLLEEYALSRFNTDESVVKFIDLVSNVDRLITLTQQEIAIQKNIGVVQTWEVILHTSIYTFIEQSVIEDRKFLDLEFKVMKQKLEDMAKAIEAGINAKNPTVDNILSIANNQAA